MPVTAISFLFCSFSVMGIPPFGGFFCKYMVFAGASGTGHFLVSGAFLIGAFLTILYLFRVFNMVFLGEARLPQAREAGPVMVTIVSLLAIAALFSGIFIRYPCEFVQAAVQQIWAVIQLFAYEVPLFMSILAAALLANTWSLAELVVFYTRHPLYCLFNLAGFAISLLALLGKLEKVPFDIPEAETEIVAGAFTEYSGRRLALLRLTIDVEMVAGSSLLVAVFFPFALRLEPVIGFLVSSAEVLAVIAMLSLMRSVAARLRIDQMIRFCWKLLVPVALVQLLANLILKRILL
jgi:NADH-quinone oxidoreductase subunit H